MIADTITAVATAPGVAGIAVIRTSGSLVPGICRSIFRCRGHLQEMKSHHFYYGEIVSPSTGRLLDLALVSLMRAPRSYTGEDVLEIHAHGSPLVVENILEAIISQGARMALPGEFTRRALLNGKIDGIQAEAIGELLNAHSPLMADVALKKIAGGLSQKIHNMRERLEQALALIEAGIDFGEEDASIDRRVLLEDLSAIRTEAQHLVQTYREGRLLTGGVSCILLGRTNVGKSSLLNALVGKKRAIVSVEAGTTRDFIEDSLVYAGLWLRFMDTAGIRAPESEVERQGIELVWENLPLADVAILVLDGSQPLTQTDEEIAKRLRHRDCIVAVNKSDLPSMVTGAELRALLPECLPIFLSAKSGDGILELKKGIQRLVGRGRDNTEEVSGEIVTKAHHKAALEGAIFFLSQAIANVVAQAYEEIIAQDLREALLSITSITKPTDSEDVLERIFADFCVGK